jgi:hypothetical protein
VTVIVEPGYQPYAAVDEVDYLDTLYMWWMAMPDGTFSGRGPRPDFWFGIDCLENEGGPS